ncbi:MAG: hydrogenase maturation protease, partial [Gaiellales bacterium]
MSGWSELERPGASTVTVDGVTVGPGSRVRMRPAAGGDVWSSVLEGGVGVVESIEEDTEGGLHLVVVAEDDPGRDLGLRRMPGHRFFFSPGEVEPLPGSRVLVAGIGNMFLGDDGFGCEVARRLAGQTLPAGCRAADFGIRGLDLAYAMQDGWDAVLLIDAAPRGEPPGTLSVIEPDVEDDAEVTPDAHGMDPVAVLRLARALGGLPRRTLVLACAPQRMVDPDAGDELLGELTPPVLAAVDEA